MNIEEIAKNVPKAKGFFADESTGTIAKKFKSINVENLEKNRLLLDKLYLIQAV